MEGVQNEQALVKYSFRRTVDGRRRALEQQWWTVGKADVGYGVEYRQNDNAGTRLVGIGWKTVNAVFDVMMKRCLLLALMLVLASPWALANPGNERNQARQANRQNGMQRQQPPNNPPRDAQQQGFQRDNGGGEAQRPQRMSPEERRQLRRDIRDAGREVYPRQ